jgi:hypothetical protein
MSPLVFSGEVFILPRDCGQIRAGRALACVMPSRWLSGRAAAGSARGCAGNEAQVGSVAARLWLRLSIKTMTGTICGMCYAGMANHRENKAMEILARPQRVC